jgi:hypothetical protein
MAQNQAPLQTLYVLPEKNPLNAWELSSVEPAHQKPDLPLELARSQVTLY